MAEKEWFYCHACHARKRLASGKHHWCKCYPEAPFRMSAESVLKSAQAVMRDLGSRGGRKAAITLTPEQRVERARKAGKASGKARREK
jgi:hypothetical protein